MINFLFISIEESFFIIFIAIIIFGPKKIPDIARSMGEGIRYLRNAKNKIQNEISKNNINSYYEKKQKSIKKSKIYSSIKRN
ncbi:twin-arginine translocase TatA/TatE family subunit [Blattabacterium sp. (Cryptocercus punctulatus) str. Cpu]|uniref:Sec-independent protein translocase subunit TatA/TatB n=1 Tax=Blattabacterium sp. (Cryptocercus punctulatus) str. Cpu TaxID=1075399 RepID=UPI0002387246|nr:twin-arginine translocase TatA/TatE family subunit [Blattabacterium sp. (Cryptocercus punctulatus) str. Cpu]AEU09153.1 putative Sec-independent-protein-translocase protein TatA/E [Blattabacterium sp. (Cryptocercus punctulatus) str. Cpu]